MRSVNLVTKVSSSAVAVAVAIVVGATAGNARNRSAGPVDTRLMRSVVRELEVEQPFSGTLAVVESGHLVLIENAGLADRSAGTRTSLHTRFRLNTLTTVFTAVALAQLQDRDRLRLDASVCAYVPRCPAGWHAISVEMLFGPATGLRKLRASRWRTPPSPAEYVEALRHERLNFAPGTKWPRADPRLASGVSPEILAAYVLERVSGRPWLDYVRTNIFRPSRMDETSFEAGGGRSHALGYVRAKAGAISLAPARAGVGIVSPDVVSGLWASVRDYVRFDNALWHGRLLSGVGLAFLSRISLPVERSRGVGWSCCWLVGKTPEGEEVHLNGAHSGLPDGFYAGYARYPQRDLTFVLFTNMGGNRPVWSAFDVLGSIGRGVYPPVAPTDDSLLGAVAGTYVGRPGSGRPLRMMIMRNRRGLVCQTSDQELSGRIAHLADDRFFYRVNPNQRVVFLRDALGEITALEITNLAYQGFQLRLRRVR